jgi:hypothetical protein
MVAHSRATLGARDLRPLNAPVPVEVELDSAGRPWAVQRRAWSEFKGVAEVLDRWRIDDEWWRERPVSRLYHALLLEDGGLLVVYHDLVEKRWYEQRSRS